MSFGIGFISAILIAKKHFRKGKSRLTRLRQQLDKHPLKTSTFYELPIKHIFSILAIIVVVFFFNYFQEHYLLEILSLKSSTQPSTISQAQQHHSNYGKLCHLLKLIKTFYIFCIIIITSQLKFKIITIESTHLTLTSYNRLQFGQKQVINWSSKHSIKIFSKGQQRFSNYTNYYTLEIIYSSQQTLLQQEIITYSTLFHAKKSLIQISNILHFIPDLHLY